MTKPSNKNEQDQLLSALEEWLKQEALYGISPIIAKPPPKKISDEQILRIRSMMEGKPVSAKKKR